MEHAHLLAGSLLVGLAAYSTAGTVTSLAVAAGSLPATSTGSVAVRGRGEPTRYEELRPAAASAERVVASGRPVGVSLDLRVTNPRAVHGTARVFLDILALPACVAATGTV